MDKQKPIEEMHKEYVEWCIGLLKTRFDLKPEYYDEHHHDNFTYECGAESLWGKIENALNELLWLRERQIPEGAVVLTEKKELTQFEWSKMLDRMGFFKFADNLRKETAEKFAKMAKDGAFVSIMGEPIIWAGKIDEILNEIIGG